MCFERDMDGGCHVVGPLMIHAALWVSRVGRGRRVRRCPPLSAPLDGEERGARAEPRTNTAARKTKVICFLAAVVGVAGGGGHGEFDGCDSHCDPNRGFHAPLSFDRPQSDWFCFAARSPVVGPRARPAWTS